jgi:hypothetical protein
MAHAGDSPIPRADGTYSLGCLLELDGGCIAPCSEKTLKLWDASGRRKATLVQTLMSDY